MDDKAKLVVFDKKEVFLILIFMVLIACFSFFLGLHLGKKMAFKASGFTEQDQQSIDLKSKQEEEVARDLEEHAGSDSDKDANDLSQEQLKKAFEELEKKPDPFDPKVNPETPEGTTSVDTPVPVAPAEEPANNEMAGSDYSGKYTIQLGSHQTLDEAKRFADGFRVRGYNPIINEVTLKDKGLWYRVSLGAFKSVAEAKTYIEKEQTLFQGKDYVIARFE